ncbi:MAG: FG-GAP repeat domain-containing protein [Vicinamibacterales bacterium]
MSSDRIRQVAYVAIGGMAWVTAASAQPVAFVRDSFSSFSGARGIAAADFDRNGWVDVAHANSGRNTVTVLLNRGHQTPAFVRTYDVAVGVGPFDLTTSDFNRDGIPDIAVTNADGNSVSILTGRASGGFARADVRVSAGPRAIAAADINRDGKRT